MRNNEKVRFPAVAGQFYPDQKEELEGTIKKFLSVAKIPQIEGEVFAMISPHAGYLFSGVVASHSFQAISGEEFECVILIGDSHYEWFDGVSIWDDGIWYTPLGGVKIHKSLAQKILTKSKRFFVRESAHLFEHSLEVQIPFLQMTLKDFKILPIIFGSEDKDWKILAQSIVEVCDKEKILVIASSDLSHYPPYDIAQRVDRETIEGILSGDPLHFSQTVKKLKMEYPNIDTFACAQDSIKTVLEISKTLKGRAQLLKYQNSGDSMLGERSKVVGYCSICFMR